MAANPKSWMASFQKKRIYELLIPGTHDSGTEGFPVGSPSRTQFYKINEQLDGGVRFLDMRLAYNSAEDNFHIVHAGDVLSYLNFDTVVKWCADFLKAHQTETILMSIKQEGTRPGSDAAFAAGLAAWHAAHAAKGDWKSDLWFIKADTFPTVSEARSRIVLLRRYTPGGTPTGTDLGFYGGLPLDYINDHEAGSFPMVRPKENPTPAVPYVDGHVQDAYKLGGDEKKTKVSQMLTEMGSYHITGRQNEMAWHINFASTGSPGPLRASKVINPWLKERLARVKVPLYGVLITDYAQPELWQQIYTFNR
jgi:hypothetical protein